MIKRITLAAVAALAAAALALPALAGNGGQNASQFCKSMNDFGLSHGACVSSVVQGFDGETGTPSRAAFMNQCKQLEPEFAATNQGRPYPYAFYGNAHRPEYVAKNRADCARILYAFHTGQLAPGPQA